MSYTRNAVGRPRHSDQDILDATGELLLESGPRAATIEAIVQASGAPKGSIYYRFKSRDEIFASLWIRAAERFQDALLASSDQDDPLEATVSGALAVYDFCAARRVDARLLLSFGQQDLWSEGLPANLLGRLRELNRPIGRAQRDTANRLYGVDGPEALARLRRAVFDIPFGIAREHVTTGAPLPAGARIDVEHAVRAVLAAPLVQPRSAGPAA
jgi:AcrR family transcriptional regulator